MQKLTKKEKIVFESIKDFFNRTGKKPTVRELKQQIAEKGLCFKSIRSVFLYLNRLEEKGLIKRTRKSRGIEITADTKGNLVDVPILGAANAGDPALLAEENLEGYLKVSKNIIKGKNVFAVKIDGSSMNRCRIDGKNIADGDFVIIDFKDRSFKNNNKVLIEISGSATVKLYKKISKNRIGLFPMSSDKYHQPIYLTPKDEFMILGKIIDVFKNIESLGDSEEIKIVPISEERPVLRDKESEKFLYY